MKISDIDTFRSNIGAEEKPKEEPKVVEKPQEPIITIGLTKDEQDWLKTILLEKRRAVKSVLRNPATRKVARERNYKLLGIITNLEYKINNEHKKI